MFFFEFIFDYILVRKRFRNQIHRYETYPGPDVIGDNNFLMKCNVVFEKLDNRRGMLVKKWNVQILKETKVQGRMQNAEIPN